MADVAGQVDPELALPAGQELRERLELPVDAVQGPGAMPSTLANSPAKKLRSPGRVGATEKPQLPASTVVTPWKHEAVA